MAGLSQSVSQSVCLDFEPILGLASTYYFLSEGCCLVSVRRPLSREGGSAVCSAITPWSESCITRNHALLSHPRLPDPLFPQEQGGPVIPPGTGFPLRRLLRLVGLRWRSSNLPPTWRARSPYIYPPGTWWSSPKTKSGYDRRSVNQYVFVSSQRGFRGVVFGRILIRH
jgi:hypothetical protein